MIKPHEAVPGVPAAGHIAGGFWHSGPIKSCPTCKRADARRARLRSQLQSNSEEAGA